MGKKRKRTSLDHTDLGLNTTACIRSDDLLMECLQELEQCQGGDLKVLENRTEIKSQVNEAALASSEAAQQEQFETIKPKNNHLPNNFIAVELIRHLYAGKLSKWFLEEGKGIRLPSLERWLLDSKLEEKEAAGNYSMELKSTQDAQTRLFDPILPSETVPASPASQRLKDELVEHFQQVHSLSNIESSTKAEQILRQLCSKSNEYASLVYNEVQRTKRLKKPPRIQREPNDGSKTMYALVLEHKYGKKPFVAKINISHYDKLCKAFCKSHEIHDLSHQHDLHEFHRHVFALLLRYSSMAGGQLLKGGGGGGMQGSIHAEVFQVLHQKFNCQVAEIFASPFNKNCSFFCSAFPDLDSHFGSRADFFAIPIGALPNNTVYEVNPPFVPGLMTRMSHRIDRHLVLADKLGYNISFVIVVPTYHDSKDQLMAERSHQVKRVVHEASKPSFMFMKKSLFCRLDVILPSKQHGYIEGSQHLRPTLFKESNYDTSVLLLQSQVARKHTNDTDWEENFKADIKLAFDSKHKLEIIQRQEAKTNKDAK